MISAPVRLIAISFCQSESNGGTPLSTSPDCPRQRPLHAPVVRAQLTRPPQHRAGSATASIKRTARMLIARLHDVGVRLDEDDDTGPDRRPPIGADLGGFIASETLKRFLNLA